MTSDFNSDCIENKCIEELNFPKHPNNRPGLSHIDYRIGTYSDFLEFILRNLNRDPLLSLWTHREADDPGIALLQGASILGDILTFYQNLYANEAYNRTAQWRESIADLVRLTGYRLSPGVGGKATFAVEVKNSNNKPVVIPKGFPIKTQLDELEQTVDFETLREGTAYPHMSKFSLYRAMYTPLFTKKTKEFYIVYPDQSTTSVSLEEGDRLLVGIPHPSSNPTCLINSQIVIIEKIRQLFGHKLYKIKGKFKYSWNINEIGAIKLGRDFLHFGHNTASKFPVITKDAVKMENQLYIRPLSVKTLSIETPTKALDGTKGVRILDPPLSKKDFPIDSKVNDLSIGNPMVIQGLFLGWDLIDKKWTKPREFTLVRKIKNIKTLSMTWGTITGSTSLISIDSELTTVVDNCRYYAVDIRYLQFYEVDSPLLTLRSGLKKTSEKKGKNLYFFGTNAEVQLLKNRNLLFKGPMEKTFLTNIVAVQSLSQQVADKILMRRITLDRKVKYKDFPIESPKIEVYGNLIEANQGKTENEIVLGNGDNQQKFQTFKLPKAPLTYHTQSTETPPEVPELEIYVNDRLWKQVSTFFGHSSKEEIYIVREDSERKSLVQFGDGKTGIRLPTGIRNVKAVFRTGIGAYGNLKEDTNPQPGGKLNWLEKIHMPEPASGGEQPESGDNAKEAAPGKVQSLGRLVSLKDFESEALAIAGVSKAASRWEVTFKGSEVVLTVLMKSGRSGDFSNVQNTLNKYNLCRGPQRFPVRVIQGKRFYIYTHAEFGVDSSYRGDKVKAAIKMALGVTGEEGNGIDGKSGLFGLDTRRFGSDAYASRIEGVIQKVEGVVWVKVTALCPLGETNDPSKLIPSIKSAIFKSKLTCDDLHLFCLYKTHLHLSIIKDEIKKEC